MLAHAVPARASVTGAGADSEKPATDAATMYGLAPGLDAKRPSASAAVSHPPEQLRAN